MEREIFSLSDFLAALRRRKWSMVSVMALVLIVSVALALGLPPVYRSTATVLIEQREVPEDFVPSTVTAYADQQINVVSQRVLTSGNLAAMIEKFDLFQEARKEEPIEALVGRMRKSIVIEPVSASDTNPRTGRETAMTIAFTVSYEAKSPVVAQKIANELATLFLRENVARRTEIAAGASTFLREEADKLKKQIAELEAKLAAFKEENAGRLPELSDLNRQFMERTEQHLSETQRELRSLKEQKIYLEGELAQVHPNTGFLVDVNGQRILGPADRLRALQSEYVSVSARYSPEHPDSVKLRKEIAALEHQLGEGSDFEALQSQLAAQHAQLAAVRDRYSDEHPDVKRLQRAVAELEKRLQSSPTRTASSLTIAARPDNPAYIQLQARLDAVRTELRALEQSEQDLKAKLSVYEERLIAAPQVERQYLALTRDHESTVAEYREIKAKRRDAELAEALERSSKGEHFSLVNPPQLPQEPDKPNRLAIVFLGVVLSFGGGIGTAALRDALDQTVRGPKGLLSLLNAAPLAVIPYVENQQDRRRKMTRWAIAIAGAAALVVGGAILVDSQIVPLETVWSNVRQNLGLSYQTSVS